VQDVSLQRLVTYRSFLILPVVPCSFVCAKTVSDNMTERLQNWARNDGSPSFERLKIWEAAR